MSSDEKVVDALIALVSRLEGINPFQKQIITAELKSENGVLFSRIVQGGVTGISSLVLLAAASEGPSSTLIDEQITQALLTTQILQMESAWDAVFKDCSTEVAKEVSRADAQRLTDVGNLMYGEVAWISFAQVMWGHHLKLASGGVFYDLGSGSGRALVAAAMLHDFRKVVGIELLEGLHLAAQRTVQQFDPSNTRGISCVCGSFMDYDWSDADIVFTNSTCFDDRLMGQLALKAKFLKIGARFITTTRRLESPFFKLVWSHKLPMSWGKATIFVQRRVRMTPESFLTNGVKHGDRPSKNAKAKSEDSA